MRTIITRISFPLLLLLAGCGSPGATPDDDEKAASTETSASPGTAAAAEQIAPLPVEETVVESPAPPEPARPLQGEPGEWTWQDIDGAKCANGSPTGVGVNPSAEGSEDLLIFLQGGGACWDGASCWGPTSTSFFIRTGYGRVEFELDILRPGVLPLRKWDPFNPFRTMHQVYVPYCTGDVHSGNAVVTYDFLGEEKLTYHVGARNLDLILARVKATFPSVRRVFLAGDSAGGFGSALNLDRVQQAFGETRVDVIDDSGQPIQPDPARWASWRAAWNMQLPADCATCSDDVTGFIDYYRTKYPRNRFALISYTNDSVISTFMGLLPTTFFNELYALAEHIDTRWPNARYYFLPGALHVGFATPTPGLVDWLQQMIDEDPAWESHKPF